MGSPILNYFPGGGVPIITPLPPPFGHVAGEDGIAPLVQGQSYIDVVFTVAQPRTDWAFIECRVVNTGDPNPLNIWPGIVTSKTTSGFRLQLNGLPDTGNYYLYWSISGATVSTAGVATTYLFSGPGFGSPGVASAFVVALPEGTSADVPVTITPHEAGTGVSGTFSPPSVVLTTGSPSANFNYTPASYGSKMLSTTNDSGLSDPASLSLVAVASTYTLTGPSSGSVGVPSTNFTAALPAGGAVIGTVTITPNDSGGGGTFTPATVGLTTAAPSATFTYTAASGGTKTISVANNGGLTNPASLSYALPLSDGSPVSTWADSSGNGHTATQTGSARPIFKTGIIGGKPVVRFTTAGLSGLNLASTISGAIPWTAFAVMNPIGAHITGLSSSVTPGAPYALVLDSGNIFIANLTNYSNCVYGLTGFHVFSGNAVSGSIYFDGTLQASVPGSIASTGGFDNLGYRSFTPAYSDGDIAELIFYNVDLSTTNRANIEKYLGTKYGITVAGGSAVDPSTVTGLVGWWKADAGVS